VARAALEREAGRAQHLQGQTCSQVSLGADDTVIIDLGPLRPAESGELAGELTLLIDCPWRLDGSETPLCGWHDDDDRIVTQLSQLIGVTIESVEVRRPGYDLILRCSEGYTLRLFPDLRAYFIDNLLDAGPWHVTGASLSEAPSSRPLPP
jgi:hypothetical protein